MDADRLAANCSVPLRVAANRAATIRVATNWVIANNWVASNWVIANNRVAPEFDNQVEHEREHDVAEGDEPHAGFQPAAKTSQPYHKIWVEAAIGRLKRSALLSVPPDREFPFRSVRRQPTRVLPPK